MSTGWLLAAVVICCGLTHYIWVFCLITMFITMYVLVCLAKLKRKIIMGKLIVADRVKK